MEWDLTDLDLPRTFRASVDSLLHHLGEENLALIRITEYDDLIDHHFGLGLLWIKASAYSMAPVFD
jgi:hypothetical protein